MIEHAGQSPFPRRHVHLDFHTGPAVPDVGSEFDGDLFVRAFRDAQVESVTVFAKCHHGHLYFATERPERHPNLVDGLDLLGQQIEALHGAGIRAPIYVSVQCDEYAANLHPEWVVLTPQLEQLRRVFTNIRPVTVDAFTAGWQILDMSSPYQEYLAAQVEEILSRFGPVDGMFFDMCWDQPSCSKWAMEGMRGAHLDPTDAAARSDYANSVALSYMERFSQLVEPNLTKGSPTGVWFNSRPRTALDRERRFLRHVEIEALPTGSWGYDYLPYIGRLVRHVGLPVLSQTGRFHRSWGDVASLKAPAALRYDCTRALTYGHACSVGDLLPATGKPGDAVYRLIAAAYEYVKACEPFVEAGSPVVDVALVADPALGDEPGPAMIGAVKLLQRLRQQFDVVPAGSSLDAYAVIVIPDSTLVSGELAAEIRSQVTADKAVIVAAAAVPATPEGDDLMAALGVRRAGVSPFSTVFFAPTPEGPLQPATSMPIRVHGESLLLEPLPGTQVLADMVNPFFERTYEHFSGHSYTPPGASSGYGAVFGRGRIFVLAVPLFAGVAEEANPEYERVLGACLERALPAPALRAGGPRHLETAVVQAGEATVVHLLSYLPSRLGYELDLVFDPFPLVDVDIEVRMRSVPRRVSQQPAGKELDWAYQGGYVTTKVTVLDGHTMVVLEP